MIRALTWLANINTGAGIDIVVSLSTIVRLIFKLNAMAVEVITNFKLLKAFN